MGVSWLWQDRVGPMGAARQTHQVSSLLLQQLLFKQQQWYLPTTFVLLQVPPRLFVVGGCLIPHMCPTCPLQCTVGSQIDIFLEGCVVCRCGDDVATHESHVATSLCCSTLGVIRPRDASGCIITMFLLYVPIFICEVLEGMKQQQIIATGCYTCFHALQ